MSYIKHSKCTKCGREFRWVIQRPGDSYWDRWKSDDGDTLGRWFLAHNLCWHHAFEEMPEKFARLIRTIEYTESPDEKPETENPL